MEQGLSEISYCHYSSCVPVSMFTGLNLQAIRAECSEPSIFVFFSVYLFSASTDLACYSCCSKSNIEGTAVSADKLPWPLP